MLFERNPNSNLEAGFERTQISENEELNGSYGLKLLIKFSRARANYRTASVIILVSALKILPCAALPRQARYYQKAGRCRRHPECTF